MKGEKREGLNIKLKVGFVESKVITISPDNEGLRKIGYNIDEEKAEPEYLKEKDGVDTVRLDFIMQTVKEGYKYKRTFFLEDQIVATKPKDDDSDEVKENFVSKTQFINQTGDSFYAESKELLPEWFTNFMKGKGANRVAIAPKEVRPAKVGEAALMDFIKKWLELDYFKPSTDILLNLKDIFKGKFTELTEQINGGNDATLTDLLEVNRVEKEGEQKEYQAVYKTALPGYLLKTIRNITFTPEKIDTWKQDKFHKTNNPTGRYLKPYEELAIEITDDRYGSKNYFLLEPFQDYDETKNPAVFEGNPEETIASGY